MPMKSGAKVTPPFYRSTAVRSGVTHALRREVVESQIADAKESGVDPATALASVRVKAVCGATIPVSVEQRYQVSGLLDGCGVCNEKIRQEREANLLARAERKAARRARGDARRDAIAQKAAARAAKKMAKGAA